MFKFSDRGRVVYVGADDKVFSIDDLQTEVGTENAPTMNYFDLFVGNV